MKTHCFSFIVILAVLFSVGCKKSTQDEFNNANGITNEKYIQRVEIFSSITIENKSYTVNYDGSNRVSSITDGSQSRFFNYSSDNALMNVSDGNKPFIINDLYQSPYDAFETGDVLEYDIKGNPIRIQVYENGYNSNLLTGEIIYDGNPNPFFYTIKATGLIDVIDHVDLNLNSTSTNIIKARLLLPYNNVIGAIFKDSQGNTKYEVHAQFQYNTFNYPITASVNTISPDGSKNYTINYYYR